MISAAALWSKSTSTYTWNKSKYLISFSVYTLNSVIWEPVELLLECWLCFQKKIKADCLWWVLICSQLIIASVICVLFYCKLKSNLFFIFVFLFFRRWDKRMPINSGQKIFSQHSRQYSLIFLPERTDEQRGWWRRVQRFIICLITYKSWTFHYVIIIIVIYDFHGAILNPIATVNSLLFKLFTRGPDQKKEEIYCIYKKKDVKENVKRSDINFKKLSSECANLFL